MTIRHVLISEKKGGAESVVENYLKVSSKSEVFYSGESLGVAFRKLKSENKDVLYCLHSLRDFSLTSLLGYKSLFFVHFRYSYIKRLFILFLTKVSRSRLVFVGFPGRDRFESMGYKSGLFIHNFVVPSSSSIVKTPRSSQLRVCWIGSIKPGKNWEHIFLIAKELLDKKESFRIDIYGPIEDKSFLGKVSEYKDIFYCGITSDTITTLSHYDVLLYTAYNKYEMAPMILLEAAEALTPVACYRSEVNDFYFKQKGVLPVFKDFSGIAAMLRSGGELVVKPSLSTNIEEQILQHHG
jgi:glycosyltransferase involved in cell wall biosynthesis